MARRPVRFMPYWSDQQDDNEDDEESDWDEDEEGNEDEIDAGIGS